MDIAFSLLILFVVIMSIIGNKSEQYNIYWILVLLLIVFCGIRDPFVFRDMPNYYSYFKFGYFEDGEADDNVNVGFWLLNVIVKCIISNFIFFSFLTSFIIIKIYSWFILKYSINAYLSLVLFVFLAYFSCFFLLRQYLAVPFTLIAFYYLLQRNQIKFLLWTIIATSFHTSALIILPMYYVYSLPINKRNIIVLFISSIILAALLHTVASFVMSFSEYYSQYLSKEYEANVIRLVMKAFYVFLLLYSLRMKAFDKQINFLLLLCALVECILYFGSSGIDGICRLRAYFELGEFIGVPVILAEATSAEGNKRYLIRIGAYAYIVLIFLSCFSFLSSENFEGGYNTFLSSAYLGDF